jgi:hypothetical protein
MENLTPPLLHALREIRWLLLSGKPMKEALQTYLNRTENPFAAKLREMWIIQSRGGNSTPNRLPTYFQMEFWNLIERGCAGQPVLESLEALEAEVQLASEAELDEHLASLPFKVLIPLLLFQFPAYLLLLLGPMLRELQHHLGG